MRWICCDSSRGICGRQIPDMFEIVDGWWRTAEQRRSPNCDDRPEGAEVELLVLHNISLPADEFGGNFVDDLFMNCLDCGAHPSFSELSGLEVSAHLLIRRDGTATQYVPFHRRAWHAGKSSFQGRERCNDFSIGIELEGSDFQPFSDAQYKTLAAVTDALLIAYPALSAQAIVGHSDIAPGRKTDPGPHFDWQRFRSSLSVKSKRIRESAAK